MKLIYKSVLTNDVNFESVVDAAELVAEFAGVAAGVGGDQILQRHGPLAVLDASQGPLGQVAVLVPGDVGHGIAVALALQAHHVSGRFHQRLVHLLGPLERRRTQLLCLVEGAGGAVQGHGLTFGVLARQVFHLVGVGRRRRCAHIGEFHMRPVHNLLKNVEKY
jgi:hypothetical protein